MANTPPVIPPRVRDWLYPVALAGLALAGGYGLVTDQEIALWGALVAAVLGLGTATAYRPNKTIPDGTGRRRATTQE